jgi:hypothetical protein
MKVRVLLLVVSLASLLAALVCATGAIVNRGGGPGSQGIIGTGPQATGAIIQRGGSGSGGSTAA